MGNWRECNYPSWLFRLLVIVALLFTGLALIGAAVFTIGYNNAVSYSIPIDVDSTSAVMSFFWEPYISASVLSFIALLLMLVKGSLMGLFHCCKISYKNWWIIYAVTSLAFAITVVLLCLNGYFLVQMRILLTTGSRVQFNETGDGIQFPQSAIDQIFAGAFIEVFFMVWAWVFYTLAHAVEKKDDDSGSHMSSKRFPIALTSFALISVALTFIGWLVFLITFINAVKSSIPVRRSLYWEPYWTSSVISFFSWTSMAIMGILMIICFLKKDFRWFYVVIHLLAAGAFACTVLVLPFLGYILVQMKILIQTGTRVQFSETGAGIELSTENINGLFAGAFIEVFFLGGAWIFYIFTHCYVRCNSEN